MGLYQTATYLPRINLHTCICEYHRTYGILIVSEFSPLQHEYSFALGLSPYKRPKLARKNPCTRKTKVQYENHIPSSLKVMAKVKLGVSCVNEQVCI